MAVTIRQTQYTRATAKHLPIAPLILFSLLSGCRPGECRAMRWSNIVLGTEAAEILLRADQTKTAQDRSIDLKITPTLIALLCAMKLRAADSAFVFGSERFIHRWSD